MAGAILLVASWRMDRLDNLGINPWSIPGLTPGVVGILMMLVAGALALQTVGRTRAAGQVIAAGQGDAATTGDPDVVDDASLAATDAASSGGLRPALLAGALCVAFAGIALGHGLPFMVEAAVFVFLFTTVFSWADWRARGRVAQGLATALAIAVVSAGAIAWLFESVFLVRLP